MLSIVTPAFNEAPNLLALYDRLLAVMATLGDEWEWVIVDDHSSDDTFSIVEALSMRDARVKGLRLARNSGSHVAIACGLHHVEGDAAAMMAADLQDPPETLRDMVNRWRGGAQVVWAVRRERPGAPAHAGFATVYYWIMRRMAGMTDMPARGADFFLIDRVVIEAFRLSSERNTSVLALIMSLGFRQEQVEYDKQARAAGSSGWTLGRKVKLVVDSVTAFSALPLRLCVYAGLALGAFSVALAAIGIPLLPSLGAGLLFVLAAIFGLAALQLIAVGILGEYLWRTLHEARRHPAYFIEARAGRQSHQGAVK